MRGAELNRGGEIRAHAHRQQLQAVALARSWRSARNAVPALPPAAECTSARKSSGRICRGRRPGNASASCGSTPAFCGSAPVLISTNSSGCASLLGDLLGQRLAQARPIDRMNGVEQRHRLLRLVGLQRPDQMQLDAGDVSPSAAAIWPWPPARGFRRTRAGRRRSPARSRRRQTSSTPRPASPRTRSRPASRQARAISARTWSSPAGCGGRCHRAPPDSSLPARSPTSRRVR